MAGANGVNLYKLVAYCLPFFTLNIALCAKPQNVSTGLNGLA